MSVEIVTPFVSAVGRIASSVGEQHGRELDRSPRQLQLAERDARDVEEIFDQRGLRLGVALDHFERVRAGRVVERPRPQQRDPADDRVQRRAQLVRERAEEIVLDAIGRVGFVARGLFERDRCRAARVPRGSDAAARARCRAARPPALARRDTRRRPATRAAILARPRASAEIPQQHRAARFVVLFESAEDVACRCRSCRLPLEHEQLGLDLTQQDRRIGQTRCFEHRMSRVPQYPCPRGALDASRSTTRMRPPFTSTMHGPGVRSRRVQPGQPRGTLTTDLIREEPKHDDSEGHA